MRQVQAVPVLGPATHQHADRGPGAGERDEHGAGAAFGEDRLGDGADRAGDARGGGLQGGREQGLVLGARLVLDGQRLRVVRAAALDGLLALLGGRFQLGVREVLEQPADVLWRVTGEVGASEGLGQHGGLLPFGGGCGGAGYAGGGGRGRDVRGEDGEEDVAGVLGEPGQQSVGGVQFGGVRGGVDDGDHRVEAGARDVVRVPVAGAVGRVVVGREDEAGAYRVAGVVDGQDG